MSEGWPPRDFHLSPMGYDRGLSEVRVVCQTVLSMTLETLDLG